jgi:hypothetical protein
MATGGAHFRDFPASIGGLIGRWRTGSYDFSADGSSMNRRPVGLVSSPSQTVLQQPKRGKTPPGPRPKIITIRIAALPYLCKVSVFQVFSVIPCSIVPSHIWYK